jgi:hypothetical protein
MKPRSSKLKNRTHIAPVAKSGTLPSQLAALTDIVSSKVSAGKIYSFDLNIATQVVLIASGLQATRSQFTAGIVQLLAKLAACFAEFRYRGVRITPRVSYATDGTVVGASSLVPGYCSLWLDEAVLTTTAPTVTDMSARQTLQLPLSSAVRPDAKR